jgi:hypothetical protein
MIVRLVVRNAAGTLSPSVQNADVRVFPAGLCGYGF